MASTWETPIHAQLSQLDLSGETIEQVVRALAARPPMPDEVGRKHIEQERRRLADRYARGEITEADLIAQGQQLSTRLAAIEAAPVASGITSDRAVAYLRNLSETWKKASRCGLAKEQADLVHAV